MTATHLRPAERALLHDADDGWLERVEVVTPAMCGHNSLFIGQLGDWTWDAVGASCDLDTYSAVDDAGDPVYLSFSYFRVQASTGLDPQSIGFGDRLRVRSKVFACGGESVLTVHRVQRAEAPSTADDDIDEFFRYSAPDCIHVENFNRWITRSQHDSNHGLQRAAPVGFEHTRLPKVPAEHSPRRHYAQARATGSFAAQAEPEPQTRLTLDYPVEASRDLNGAGLLYFASYFSIVDWGVLRLWRHVGYDDRRFLSRAVLDQQMCFLGNADADDVLRVDLALRSVSERVQVVDTTLTDAATDTVLAVSRQRIRDDGGESQ